MSFDLSNDPENELPDWLKQPADDSGQLEDESAPREGNDESLPEWLSSADQQPEEAEEKIEDLPQGEEEIEQELGEDSADWLEVIRQRAGEEWTPLEPVSYKDGQPEVPGWLKRIRERQAEGVASQRPAMAAEGQGSGEEQASFLDQIKSFNQQDEGLTQLPEDAEVGDAAWLGIDQLEYGIQSGGQGETDGSMDEILASIRKDSEAPVEDSRTFDMDQFTQQAEEGFIFDADQALEQTEESPALELESFIESVEQAPTQGESDEGPGPGAEKKDDEAEVGVPEAAGWLDDIIGGEEEPGETPQWLADVRSEINNLPHESAFVMDGEENEDAVDEPQLDAASELPTHPSWLSQVERETTSLPPLEEVLAGATGGGESDLYSFEPMDTELDEEYVPDGRPEFGEESLAEVEINLAPADLPDWLQALRPSKDEGQRTMDEIPPGAPEAGSVEPAPVSGPLAELGGALPVSPPVISAPPQAATPVTGLQMTETQRKHMAMLQEMLAEEAVGIEPEKPAPGLAGRLMRWTIAMLVMLAVFIPLLLGRGSMTITGMTPAALDMQQQVKNLSSGDLVLVAVEYQPAFSGEMQAVAAPVLDQMLVQGAQLVFISSNPTGPALAEQLLNANLGQHAQISQGGYLNLGYISGGTPALVNFATDPRGSLPLPLASGASRWEQAPLILVSSAADFAAVLVISDDPENARNWIEQVQPYMGGKPMLMALSAQAGPLVSPYMQSQPRQLAGMVAGLSDATSISNNLSVSSASQYWGAYTWGSSITALLIVLVGLYALLGQVWLKKPG